MSDWRQPFYVHTRNSQLKKVGAGWKRADVQGRTYIAIHFDNEDLNYLLMPFDLKRKGYNRNVDYILYHKLKHGFSLVTY